MKLTNDCYMYIYIKVNQQNKKKIGPRKVLRFHNNVEKLFIFKLFFVQRYLCSTRGRLWINNMHSYKTCQLKDNFNHTLSSSLKNPQERKLISYEDR